MALAPTALARAWQRTSGSLDRLPRMGVVAEPSAQLLLEIDVGGCLTVGVHEGNTRSRSSAITVRFSSESSFHYFE